MLKLMIRCTWFENNYSSNTCQSGENVAIHIHGFIWAKDLLVQPWQSLSNFRVPYKGIFEYRKMPKQPKYHHNTHLMASKGPIKKKINT